MGGGGFEVGVVVNQDQRKKDVANPRWKVYRSET
jgi:hypothetical protein